MSDQPTADAPATDAQAADTTSDAPVKPTETVDYWKQRSRENEAKAKANAEAAKRLAEIEDSQKTEAERTAERFKQLESEAQSARAEALRYRIANEFHLDETGAAALEHVTSEDGMRAIAAALGTKADQARKNGNVVPREGTPTSAGDTSEREFARSIFAD